MRLPAQLRAQGGDIENPAGPPTGRSTGPSWSPAAATIWSWCFRPARPPSCACEWVFWSWSSPVLGPSADPWPCTETSPGGRPGVACMHARIAAEVQWKIQVERARRRSAGGSCRGCVRAMGTNAAGAQSRRLPIGRPVTGSRSMKPRPPTPSLDPGKKLRDRIHLVVVAHVWEGAQLPGQVVPPGHLGRDGDLRALQHVELPGQAFHFRAPGHGQHNVMNTFGLELAPERGTVATVLDQDLTRETARPPGSCFHSAPQGRHVAGSRLDRPLDRCRAPYCSVTAGLRSGIGLDQRRPVAYSPIG